MKKYLLVVLVMFLTSCALRYETKTLFKSGNYKYNISYPYNWTFTNDSTKENEYKLENGDILKTIAVIGKYIKNIHIPEKNKIGQNIFKGKVIGGEIEIFVLDKNSQIYKEVINFRDNEEVIITGMKNNKILLKFKDICDWLDGDKKNYKILRIITNINDDKAFLFVFNGISYSISYDYYGDTGYGKKDKKGILKEVYKIINSLTREKINNKNNTNNNN